MQKCLTFSYTWKLTRYVQPDIFLTCELLLPHGVPLSRFCEIFWTHFFSNKISQFWLFSLFLVVVHYLQKNPKVPQQINLGEPLKNPCEVFYKDLFEHSNYTTPLVTFLWEVLIWKKLQNGLLHLLFSLYEKFLVALYIHLLSRTYWTHETFARTYYGTPLMTELYNSQCTKSSYLYIHLLCRTYSLISLVNLNELHQPNYMYDSPNQLIASLSP